MNEIVLLEVSRKTLMKALKHSGVVNGGRVQRGLARMFEVLVLRAFCDPHDTCTRKNLGVGSAYDVMLLLAGVGNSEASNKEIRVRVSTVVLAILGKITLVYSSDNSL